MIFDSLQVAGVAAGGEGGSPVVSGAVNLLGELILVRQDGSEINCGVVGGDSGNPLVGANVNGLGELVLDLGDGTSINAGVVTQDLTSELEKLSGIEVGATANSSDAELRDRATHTGTQPIGSVSGLLDALGGKVDKVAGKQLSTEDFTSAEKDKLSGLESSRFKGQFVDLSALQASYPIAEPGDYANVDGGAGQDVVRYVWDVTDSQWLPQVGVSTQMTAAQVKSEYESNPDTNNFSDAEKAKLSVIDQSATANSTDAELRDRSTHTGTQPISSVSGLQAELDRLGAGLIVLPDIVGNAGKMLRVKADETGVEWALPPGSVYIVTPSVSVAGSPDNVALEAVIVTSPFLVSGGEDVHLETDYQVVDADGAVVWQLLAQPAVLLAIAFTDATLSSLVIPAASDAIVVGQELLLDGVATEITQVDLLGLVSSVAAVDVFGDNSGVAAFAMDGSAESVGGLAGSAVWSGTEQYVAGVFGQAAKFNGSSYLVSSDVYVPGVQASISFWFKSDLLSGYQGVVSVGGIECALISNEICVGGGNKWYKVSVIETGVWYHVVIDGSNRIWIDGVERQHTSYIAASIPDRSLRVGCRAYGGSNLKGSVDQVRVFSRLMTQSDVDVLYVEQVEGRRVHYEPRFMAPTTVHLAEEVSAQVDPGVLQPGVQYKFMARHRGVELGDSDWGVLIGTTSV